MAAKVFIRQNPTTLVWEYGVFESDGTTPKVELTFPAGSYKSRWETIDNVIYLSILNANNLKEVPPFKMVPIADVASDLIGTPYANRAAFETATKDFFFRVDGIDPTDTVLAYSKADIDVLIAKSVFSEVLVSTPVLHNGTGVSTKIFETTIDPNLGVDGWMKFSFYASMTGSNQHTFSVRVSNQSILQLAPTTTPSLKVENLLYNKNNVTKQGAGNLGGGYGTSSSALLNFDGVIDTSAPMLISVWCNATIGDSFTIDRLQLEYRK